MPIDVNSYGVGVIGTGPLFQFIRERISLRPDFQISGLWMGDGERQARWRDESPVATSPRAVFDDPRTDVIYFAGPVTSELLTTAIQTSKPLVLTSASSLRADELGRMAEMVAANQSVVILDEPRRWDEEFLQARFVFDAGSLGKLQRIRLAVHDFALPDDRFSQGVLRELGWHLLDQLLVFATSEPRTVRLQKSPESADGNESGFLATIDFADGVSAVVELQTTSLLSLRTGWLLEGDIGAYRSGRRFSLSPDGEIIDEPVIREPASTDPLFDALSAAIQGDRTALTRFGDLAHAARVMALMEKLEGA
jgi:predicted dehydrogenase